MWTFCGAVSVWPWRNSKLLIKRKQQFSRSCLSPPLRVTSVLLSLWARQDQAAVARSAGSSKCTYASDLPRSSGSFGSAVYNSVTVCVTVTCDRDCDNFWGRVIFLKFFPKTFLVVVVCLIMKGPERSFCSRKLPKKQAKISNGLRSTTPRPCVSL